MCIIKHRLHANNDDGRTDNLHTTFYSWKLTGENNRRKSIIIRKSHTSKKRENVYVSSEEENDDNQRNQAKIDNRNRKLHNVHIENETQSPKMKYHRKYRKSKYVSEKRRRKSINRNRREERREKGPYPSIMKIHPWKMKKKEAKSSEEYQWRMKKSVIRKKMMFEKSRRRAIEKIEEEISIEISA